jgi:hypothetical protein
MILYNITINVEESIHSQWMNWMKTEFIKEMLASNLFTEYKIMRLLNEVEGQTGMTYSFQFFLNSLSDLNKFQDSYQDAIDKKLYTLYKNQFVEFRSVLEKIE